MPRYGRRVPAFMAQLSTSSDHGRTQGALPAASALTMRAVTLA